MKPAHYFLLFSLFSVVSGIPVAPRKPCPRGLLVIAARGSGERPGPGSIGEIAVKIMSRVPGSDIESISYPAQFNGDDGYAWSEHQGTEAMTDLIKLFVKGCPDSKVALLGYSQGGQVVGDVLCGSSSDITPMTPPLDASYNTSVIAAVSLGSPSHAGSQSFNIGSSKQDGIFVRKDTASCEPWEEQFRDVCDAHDYYCDSVGPDSDSWGKVHGGYVDKYGRSATDFVISKAREAGLEVTD